MNKDALNYLLSRDLESRQTRKIRKKLQWQDVESRFAQLGITQHFDVKRSDRSETDNVVIDITIDDTCWVRYQYEHEIFTLEIRQDNASYVNVFKSWARVCEEIVRRMNLSANQV